MLGKPDKYDEYMALCTMVFIDARDDFIKALSKIVYTTKLVKHFETKGKLNRSDAAKLAKLRSRRGKYQRDIKDMWEMTHGDTTVIDMLGYDPGEVWQMLTRRKYNTWRPDLPGTNHYRDSLEIIRNYVGGKYGK